MTASLDNDRVDSYLERLDLNADRIRDAPRNLETLARLQAAHVRRVPFENLSIVGDPFNDDHGGEGVVLDVDHLHEKIVARERGGYCFELNGLFTSLLGALGYDVERAAAMVLDDDGDPSPPANHHTILVSLDRTYVVDVGVGSPQIRRPVPVDGEATPADAAGVRWRVTENDRPDTDGITRFRLPNGSWDSRYVFEATPRSLDYFQATCDYLSRAPESPFTGAPTVQRATETGWIELRRDSFRRTDHDETEVCDVPPATWHAVLEREFGLSLC